MAGAPRFDICRPELSETLRRGEAIVAEVTGAQKKRLSAQTEIVRMGEPNEIVYRLVAGWCARTRATSDGRKQIITVFLPGDLLAVKSMFLPRQADSIETICDVTVGCVEQSKLRRLCRENDDVAVRVLWQIVEDERRLHNWVVMLGRGNADERLASFLLSLRKRLIEAGLSSGARYEVPMTQHQIADFLGLTTVHVNRVLKRFRENGLGTVQKGVATLLDVQRLEKIASPLQDIYDQRAARIGVHLE